MGTMTMTRTWTLQCLSCNFIALIEVSMILTCTVTSSVTTVAVVMSLCPTPLNSPRGDISSPRGRATFYPNAQYPPPPKKSQYSPQNPNFPLKLFHKIPIIPQQTSSCSPNAQFFAVPNLPLNPQYFNQVSHCSPQDS